MLFGLTNIPVIFKWLMERVLHGVPTSLCVVYLDDMHAPNYDLALANLRLVLKCISKANIRLNPVNCQL